MHEHTVVEIILTEDGPLQRCRCGAERGARAANWQKNRLVESAADGYGVTVDEYLERKRRREAPSTPRVYVPPRDRPLRRPFLAGVRS